jgi:hypothetical protein
MEGLKESHSELAGLEKIGVCKPHLSKVRARDFVWLNSAFLMIAAQ